MTSVVKKPQAKKVPEITVQLMDGQSTDDAMAKLYTSPVLQGAVTICKFEADGIELGSTMAALADQVKGVKNGDMSRPEELLVVQAHTLDEIFNSLARRAHANIVAGHVESGERFMKMAMRAQNQCRTTIEAISVIKNPPALFTKQMNISNGPQQVNNGVATNQHPAMARDVTRTYQNENQQNELGVSDHELLPNARTQKAVGRTMQSKKAVAAIHRAKD
jgi:hypothetical protein